MSAVLLVIMALAAFRLWRVVGKDHWPPSEWFRDRLEDWQNGSDVRRHVQTFFLCPWCLGAYVSAVVVTVTAVLVSVPLPFLQWLAVSALVGLIAEVIDQ